MSTPTRPNSYANGQTIEAAQVNADLDTLYTWIRDQGIHRDGTNAFTSLPEGPASSPTGQYQLANKKYVDDQTASAVANRVRTDQDAVSVQNKLGVGDGADTQAAVYFKSDPDTGIVRRSGGAGVGLALQVGGVVSVSLPETTGYVTFHKRMWAPGMLSSSAGGEAVRRNPTDGNELFAYTSSRGMKENVRSEDPVQDEYVAKLLATEIPVWDALRTTEGGEVVSASRAPSQRGTAWDRMGPILEDMAKTFPEAVMRDDEGNLVGLDEALILSVLWQAVKNLAAR